MKRLHILFLLLALSFPAFAAGPLKVEGRVLEAITGIPVPGAAVTLDENYL